MQELIKMSIADIKPYPNNPRINDAAVDAVAASIQQCGYVAPIVVDEDDIILAGHTRHKALQRLNYTEVNVMRVTGLTEEQKRKYRVLDNKTNEYALWDFDKLADEIEGLDFGDFDFGFSVSDIDAEPAAPKPLDDLSDKVSEMYQVIVECCNEIEQAAVYDRLSAEGLKCRVLTL